MPGTKIGGAKMRRTMIKKYGSIGEFRIFMREIGSEGGKLGTTGGFAYWKATGQEAKIRAAGHVGGLKSKRGPSNG